ncbi:flagellar biosynthesis protein FlgN [Solirhodobacter olei]|uniref:flagellar biosynthesis protein FlgN n=1 Tax=Solirhodobacter olei TaxID=2493082 RepID=UPI000FDA7D52|nr:flagellar biosynthesis protein FlgN [Solirhodobacter olei]
MPGVKSAAEGPMQALSDLLESEMDLIRRADFPGLDGVAERKEALLAALLAGPAPAPEALERLRNQALRNAGALEAARQGLRAAARRLAEIAGSTRPQTYDAEGRRNGLAPGAGQLERRA